MNILNEIEDIAENVEDLKDKAVEIGHELESLSIDILLAESKGSLEKALISLDSEKDYKNLANQVKKAEEILKNHWRAYT